MGERCRVKTFLLFFSLFWGGDVCVVVKRLSSVLQKSKMFLEKSNLFDLEYIVKCLLVHCLWDGNCRFEISKLKGKGQGQRRAGYIYTNTTPGNTHPYFFPHPSSMPPLPPKPRVQVSHSVISNQSSHTATTLTNGATERLRAREREGVEEEDEDETRTRAKGRSTWENPTTETAIRASLCGAFCFSPPPLPLPKLAHTKGGPS